MNSHPADTVIPVRAPRQLADPPSRQRVAGIRRRLRSVYGVPAMPPHGHPIAELVLTVLSQSTNDRNRDVAYLRLRERFPSLGAGPRRAARRGRARRSGRGASRRSSRAACRRSCARSPPMRATPCTSCRWTGWLALPSPRAATTSWRSPASGARRPRACCCSRSASGRCRWTPTSRAWAPASACCPPGRPSRCCTTACSRSRRVAPSSSCTSTCCATAGAPARRALRRRPPMCPSACALGAAICPSSLLRRQPRGSTAKAITAYCRAAAATTRAWKTSW